MRNGRNNGIGKIDFKGIKNKINFNNLSKNVDIKRLSIFVVAVCLVIALIVAISLNAGKKYTFNLNEKENITRIISQKSNTDSKIEISSKDIVKNIVNYMTKETKTTKKASKNDVPSVDNYFTITFKTTNEVVYLYSDGKNYYMEKQKDGIYTLTEEEYTTLVKYLYLD